MPDPIILARRGAVVELGSALRAAALAAVVSEVPLDRLQHATALARELAEVLGERTRVDGRLASVDEPAQGHRYFGPGVGAGSPLSPPLRLEHGADGVVGRVVLDRRFEGPVGFTHGGVAALLLDELLGQAEIDAGRWGMTVRLTVSYQRPIPLDQELLLVARVTGTERRKTTITGTIAVAAEPEAVCASAEGLFVTPSEETYRRYFGAVTDAAGESADARFGSAAEHTD